MATTVTLNAAERETVIDGLIANGCCFDEADKEMLANASDRTLARLSLKLNEDSAGDYDEDTDDDDEAGEGPRGKGATGKGDNTWQAQGNTPPTGPEQDPKHTTANATANVARGRDNPQERAMATLNAEDQAVLEYGRRVLANQRAELITKITNNTEQFTPEELATWNNEMLGKLAASFKEPAPTLTQPAPAQMSLPVFFGQAGAVANSQRPVKTGTPLPQFTLNFERGKEAEVVEVNPVATA